MDKRKKENKVDFINENTILVNGRFVFDKVGWDIVSKYERYVSGNSGGYAYIRYNGEDIFIHRLLLGLPTRYDPVTKLIGEHKDTDRSNNRLSNLRIKRKEDNPKNCRKYKNSKNTYKGVCYHKHNNKWETSVQVDKKQISCGVYKNEVDAAIAYNVVVYFLFDDMAHYNPLPFVADKTFIPMMLERKANAGVCFRKERNFWKVEKKYQNIRIRKEGFKTKDQAILFLNKCKEHIDLFQTIDAEVVERFKREILSDNQKGEYLSV